MKKVALFVEGQAEQLFITELIKQVIGVKNITIDTCKFFGGLNSRKITKITTSFTSSQMPSYYFIIYDSGGDSTVKSDILDNYQELQRKSFTSIIGIRDVYPQTDIIKLKQGMKYGIPTSGIPINIVLAVNEVESWFLAEENHYANISPILTIDLVNSLVGIDIRKDSTEAIACPADKLNIIYNRANFSYHKRRNQVNRTVNALDYENLYFEVRKRNNSFNHLLMCLDSIFINHV